MLFEARREEEFRLRLQRALPLPAYGKPALLSFLRNRVVNTGASPRLTVTNVFDAGESRGLMCQFIVQEATAIPCVFVAPLAQIAFDRRHPIAREVAAYRNRSSNCIMAG